MSEKFSFLRSISRLRGKTPVICTCHFNETSDKPIHFKQGVQKRRNSNSSLEDAEADTKIQKLDIVVECQQNESVAPFEQEQSPVDEWNFEGIFEDELFEFGGDTSYIESVEKVAENVINLDQSSVYCMNEANEEIEIEDKM